MGFGSRFHGKMMLYFYEIDVYGRLVLQKRNVTALGAMGEESRESHLHPV